MELSSNPMTSPMATNNPYSPAAQQSDLSYSPDHSTIPTKLTAQSPDSSASSQNASERQSDQSPKPNPDEQIVLNDHHQHSVRNFINHSIEAENETDKGQVKFSEESQLKSTQSSPMDFQQSNNQDDDSKHELKGYNPINKEPSPTHTNHIEHDIKFDKTNEDKNVSESYNQHVEGEIVRHNDHAHHHLTQHHHNHHHHQQQQPEAQRDNLNGSLPPHEHQNDPRHQLQSQPQYHPTPVSKARHRGDILEFAIHHSSNLAISEAIFHLHIHGEDWIAENNPSLLDEHRYDSIGISLNRLVRSTLQRYTRTDSDYKGPIPKGDGFDVQFNVTDMVIEWIKHPEAAQEIVIKTTKQWMRQIVMFDSNSKNATYIEIQTKEIRHKRSKRQLYCAHAGRETRCCRYPLRVDFRKFGWDWVIAPDVYDAYYCSGECPQGYLPRNPHTSIPQLGSSVSPCCSPKKLSSLSLLYYDNNKQVIHSIIPNMAVDKCSCS